MPSSFNRLAFEKSMEDCLRVSDEQFNLVTRLIAEQIRYHEEQRQRELESSVPAVISFRIPAMMVDTLVGVEDEQAHLIAYETETELTLPRRFQNCTFTISGYDSNIRKALRIIERIINNKYCNSNSSSAYAFIADPNVDQSGTDYILCNGPINEAKYRPEREVRFEGFVVSKSKLPLGELCQRCEIKKE